MMAAIHSCSAFAGLWLDAVAHGEIALEGVGHSRAQAEAALDRALPYRALIERIREHDVRYGLLPPAARDGRLASGSASALPGLRDVSPAATRGHVGIGGDDADAGMRSPRPLLVDHGRFHDEATGRFVELVEIVHAFLSTAPALVEAAGALPPQRDDSR
jgi:hypothetical protein